jgi:hypothetical protein
MDYCARSRGVAEEKVEPQRRKDAKKEMRADARNNFFAPLRLGGFFPRLRVSACHHRNTEFMLRIILSFALLIPAAGCGTKTELLMPNGKPTPRDQRDPSQPPSPLSR